jgi:hypothetical protein
MLPPDDLSDAGAIEQPSRPMNRRDFLNERRQSILQQKHTDALPSVDPDAADGKKTWRPAKHLREENIRLRWELSNVQEQFERELATAHSSYQQQIEEYQRHLRDLMEDHNHLQEAKLELERRYQELYHNFQNAVEEEASKMITEAVHTVEITPEHTPVLLRDARKTIELHARQAEDQHIAQALYLMREAQRKAQQLEQELDQERRQMEAERQGLLNLQNSVRTQARLRYEAQRTRLRARWMGTVIMTAIMSLICFLVIQASFLYFLGLSLPTSTIAALVICAVLSFFLARLSIYISHIRESTPHIKKEA